MRGPVGKVRHEPVEGGLGIIADHVVGKAGQRGQILPSLPLGTRAVRRIVRPPSQRGEEVTDLGGQAVRSVVLRRAQRRPQQSHGLKDFRSVEEALTATDQIGDAGGGDRGLVGLGLGIDPVQHGHLAGRYAHGQQRADAIGHRGGLLGFAVMFGEDRCRAVRTLGEEFQRLGPGRPRGRTTTSRTTTGRTGPRDQCVGQRDHLRGGTVVTHEADHVRVRESARKLQQVARGRSGERVDRLIRVPDHTEAVPLAEPGIEQPLLQRVDVLVLIHDEVPVPGP